MRLAFMTHELFQPPTGGGSAELGYLVREAVSRGHDVHVIGPPVEEPLAVERDFDIRLHPFAKWEMGRYTRWRSLKYLLYPLFLERLVARLHGEWQFDALVAQHAISAAAAGALKQRLGLPVVLNFLDHLTGFMETWPFWLMPPPALAVLKRYELSMPRRCRADGVMTVTDTLADLFVANGFPRERLCPIYYGYDSTLFPLDKDAMVRRAQSPPTIVMHGSLDHHHLGQIALDAIAEVAAACPDVVFKFVGHQTPALARFLAWADRRGLTRFVRATGFVPYRHLARELVDAAVGWVPYEESSGVHCAFVAKVVEYLGVGLPVASTPLNGIRRYFSREPLVRFSGFDGRHLGRCILGWLTEPIEARNSLGPAASERVKRELDWRVVSCRALDFVEQTVARTGARTQGMSF